MAASNSNQREPGRADLVIGRKIVVPYERDSATAEVYQPPTGDQIKARLFFGPSTSEIVSVAVEDITSAELVCERRVYYEDADRGWRFGRIIAEVKRQVPRLRRFHVRFPEREAVELNEDEFHVFADCKRVDPFDALLHGGQETPFFFDRRSRFVGALIRQRAACSGQTGLISSQIELYEHQCTAIRRVLLDPRERYLLADEVGLGKTIEAGVLVRQLRLDSPHATIRILVPEHLVTQWHRELATRFSLDPDEDSQLQIQTYDQIDWIDEPPEMLVIDEAHNLIRNPLSPETRQRLEFLARSSQRLILLSATPVLGHEKELLTLLSWLEPRLYSPDQLEEFQRRVRHRQTIGRELLALRPDMQSFPLRRAVDRLRALFGDDSEDGFTDQHVLELCRELTEVAGAAEPDRDRIGQLVVELRNHISECYRLHRRMIRNRRSRIAAELATRTSPSIEYEFEQDRKRDIRESLENWRSHIVSLLLARSESNELVDRFVPIFTTLVQACYSWSGWAVRIVETRLGVSDAAVSAQLQQTMQSTELLEGERELLEELSADLRRDTDYDRIHLLVDMLRRTKPGDRIVVFMQDAMICEEAARRLQDAGVVMACCHSGKSAEQNDEEFQRFHAIGGVLVCDPTAEEGTNLQAADRLIHFDLPLNPFAIEQRIGRLDRISRISATVPSTLILSEDQGEGFDEQWFRLLDQGLGVFYQPISDLHLLVEDILPELMRSGMLHGASQWGDAIENLRHRVEDQRRENDEQDVIDMIEVDVEERRSAFSTLDDYEQDVSEFASSLNGYLRQVCKIDVSRLQKLPYMRQERFFHDTDVLLREDWFREILPDLLEPAGFDRVATMSDPNRSLLRLGHPLVDSLRRFAEQDDRGQAFVMWRRHPGCDETRPWFVLNFVIEANRGAICDAVADFDGMADHISELERLADGFLPPRFDQLYMDDGARFVTDETLKQVLARPYDKRNGDRNLSDERLSVLRATIDEDRWSYLCQQVRDGAVESLHAAAGFKLLCQQAVERVDRFFNRRLDQAAIALREVNQPERQAMLQDELRVREATIQAVQAPIVRLDSAGVILLSEAPCPSQD